MASTHESEYARAGRTADELAFEAQRGPQLAEPPDRIEDLEDVRRYVDSLDFTLMKERMRLRDHGGLGWSAEKVEYTERLYKNWLYLRRKHEDEVLPPSGDIDVFWHWHILDTRTYHHDTAAIFGYYLHHFPYFGIRGGDDSENLADAFEATQQRYLAEYGEEIYECVDEDEDGDPEATAGEPGTA